MTSNKPSKGTLAEMRGARNYAKIIEILLTTGGTTEEIVEHTGFHESTVWRYIKALRELRCEDDRNHRLLRVIEWAPDSRGYRTCPVYKLDKGRDAPKVRMSSAKKSRNYRRRKARFAAIPTIAQGHSECLGGNVV